MVISWHYFDVCALIEVLHTFLHNKISRFEIRKTEMKITFIVLWTGTDCNEIALSFSTFKWLPFEKCRQNLMSFCRKCIFVAAKRALIWRLFCRRPKRYAHYAIRILCTVTMNLPKKTFFFLFYFCSWIPVADDHDHSYEILCTQATMTKDWKTILNLIAFI